MYKVEPWQIFFRSVPRTIWVVDLALNQSQYLDPPLPSVADSFRKCIGDKSATSGICMFFLEGKWLNSGKECCKKKSEDLEITKVHHALCNRFSPGLLVHIFGANHYINIIPSPACNGKTSRKKSPSFQGHNEIPNHRTAVKRRDENFWDWKSWGYVPRVITPFIPARGPPCMENPPCLIGNTPFLRVLFHSAMLVSGGGIFSSNLLWLRKTHEWATSWNPAGYFPLNLGCLKTGSL